MNETVHSVSTILSPMFGLFYSIRHNNDIWSRFPFGSLVIIMYYHK